MSIYLIILASDKTAYSSLSFHVHIQKIVGVHMYTHHPVNQSDFLKLILANKRPTLNLDQSHDNSTIFFIFLTETTLLFLNLFMFLLLTLLLLNLFNHFFFYNHNANQGKLINQTPIKNKNNKINIQVNKIQNKKLVNLCCVWLG